MRIPWKGIEEKNVLSAAGLQRYNRLFSLFAAFYYLFYLFYQIENRVLGSIYWTALFRVVIVLLVISYYVVYGLQGGVEIHILTMYCLWAAFTRVLFGELYEYRALVMELMVMVVLFAPGILLRGEERDRYYRVLAGITVVVFSLLGIVCIISAITRSWIVFPLTGEGIGYPTPSTWRLKFLDQHHNVYAGHFLISFCLSLTLIPRAKTWLAKTAVILSAIIAFLTITLAISRNAQTQACAALGLMVGLFVADRFGKEWKKPRKAAILIVTAAVVLLGSYRLYEPIRKGLWQIYETTRTADAAVERNVKETARANRGFEMVALSKEFDDLEEEEFVEDTRDYLDSPRKELYWSALKSLQMDPRRLLIGAKIDEVMEISHGLIEEQATTFHNCFLHIVNEFGLPAMLLVAAFFLMMLRDATAVVLRDDRRFSLQDQVLILPVIALMGFNILEAKSFINFRFLSDFFFFACGMLAGVYHEKTGKE